jgi:rRNA maturation RNase YbeY
MAVLSHGRAHSLNCRDQPMGYAGPTDVLTFDLRHDPGDEAIDGEIVVSADTARREADRRGLAPVEELTRYVIHGVLHLLGMDDRTPRDRQRMRREETRILKLLAGRAVPGPVNTGSRKRPGAKGKRVNRPGPRRLSRATKSSRKTR